ncbi:MAG: type II toxin-antitoxin system HicB family antitoxin [Calditrichaeota bacterium]|nr:type II toxin-antitoxin system HicB family antitoxin [Calditrichota bacterium]
MNTIPKNYSFPVIIEHREESYIAYCLQLPEAGHSDGETIDEVLATLKSAVGIVVKEMLEAGEEIPLPKEVLLTNVEVDL